MSRAENQDREKGKFLGDGDPNQPSSSPIRQSQGETNAGDNSGPLFTMYSKIAEEEDTKMAERWQKDAEGIIIFTGLFSAVVTALAVVSIQDLRPNPQDTSSFYLEKMYRFQANPNVSHTSTSIPPVETKPPTFSPQRYAIWVNLLWFLSLVISLTCAMLATLLQQWARRYIRTTQLPRRTPQKRAQIRAFFANGVERFHVAWAVEALPALVHLSLFLFFAGLLIFLLHINHIIFIPVVSWVVLSSVAYACITLSPIFWNDSPCHAPLSSAAWLLYTTIPYVFLAALTFIPFRLHHTFSTWGHLSDLRDRFRDRIIGGIGKAVEEATSERASEINSRIVELTVDALSEDDALEKFLEVIPGLYQSGVAEHPQERPPREVLEKIEVAAGKFLDRTFSSGWVYRPVVERRLATCLNAVDVVGGPSGVANVLRTMVYGNWHGGSQSVEIGHFLMRWVKSKGIAAMAEVHCIVALILQGVPERDDRWKALALDHLGISEEVLEDYLAHGDSVLLASLVCVINQLMQFSLGLDVIQRLANTFQT